MTLSKNYKKYRDTKLNYSKNYYKNHKDEKKEYDKQRREKLLIEKLKNLKRNCVICNSPIKFNKKNISHITCSKRCSIKHKNNLTLIRSKQNYKDHLKKGKCTSCGLNKIIFKGYGSVIYCKKCHKIHLDNTRKYANVREKRFEIVSCVICGIDIRDRPSKSKYCLDCANNLRKLYRKYGIRAKEGIEILKNHKEAVKRKEWKKLNVRDARKQLIVIMIFMLVWELTTEKQQLI